MPSFSASGERCQFWGRHGQALLVGALVAVLSGLFVLETAPFGGMVSTQYQSLDRSEIVGIEEVLDAWQVSDGVRDAHCDLTESDENAQTLDLKCRFDASDSERWYQSLNELLDRLQEVTAINAYRVSLQSDPGRAPVWSLVTVTILTLALAAFLGRDNHWPGDLRRAGVALGRRPWLLLLPLVVWLFVANLGMAVSLFLGFDPAAFASDDIADAEQQMLAGIAFMLTPWMILQALLLAPVFEEVLFRGWLYDKTAHTTPRWVTALFNAWYFMLLHLIILIPGMMLGFVANPAQLSPVSIPVLFALGLTLFWVRMRFNSVTLCILLHALYNAATLAGFAWLLSNWA